MRKDWTYKKLGEVCSSDLGKTLNSKTDNGEYYPYLCAINVLWDRIDTTVLKTAKFEPSELERYSVKKGDLLVCEGGDVGRAAIWNDETVIQYQNALHRIRFKGEVIPRFCLFYLRHLKDNGTLDAKYAKGVTIKHLVKSSLLSIPIPVPPIKEQEEICSLLDKLSLVIEKKKQQVKELDNLAQAIFYDMFGDPVENEKGWKVKKMKDIAMVKIGPFGSLLHTSDYITGGTPLVNPIHMKNGQICPENGFTISDEKKKEMQPYLLKKGDVIFARRGEIGRSAIVSEKEDGYLCGTGSLFARFTEPISEVFVLYLTKSDSFIKDLVSKAKGATMLNINCKIVEELQLTLPSFSLQQSFASKIESIEKQKAAISKSIEETQKLFDYTMDKYFG